MEGYCEASIEQNLQTQSERRRSSPLCRVSLVLSPAALCSLPAGSRSSSASPSPSPCPPDVGSTPAALGSLWKLFAWPRPAHFSALSPRHAALAPPPSSPWRETAAEPEESVEMVSQSGFSYSSCLGRDNEG